MLDTLSETAAQARRMMHFHQLDREQQRQAIQRLAAAGHGDDTIARATALSVEQIRRILSEPVVVT